MPTTTLINLHLNDGSTRQYKSDEPEATYEPGETLVVDGRKLRIVSKSKFTPPVDIDGPLWTEFCKRRLGAPMDVQKCPNCDREISIRDDGSHATQATAAA